MKTLFPPYAHPSPELELDADTWIVRDLPGERRTLHQSLGRIDLDWGSRSLADVLADVDAWRADGVEGLFLDRAPAGSGGVGPVALTIRLAARRGLHRVVLNPGVPTHPLYRDLGRADLHLRGPVVGLPELGPATAYGRATGTSCTACRRAAHRRPAADGPPRRRVRAGHRRQPVRRCQPGQRLGRGRGWQRGQLNDERFMNCSRRIGVPHRRHGSPSRPYALSDRSK